MPLQKVNRNTQKPQYFGGIINGQRKVITMKDSERAAKKKYRSKGKRMTIDFYPSEADLIEHIEKQAKKQTYIKDLIRKDMNKG